MARWFAFLLLFVCLASHAAAQSNQPIPVVVGLLARPLAESETGDRSLAPQSIFMIQRVEALRSVTLRADVTTPGRGQGAHFASGTQLLLARGRDRKDYFCAAYDPRGGFVTWINSGFSVEWVCFHDSNSDGSFDIAYQTPPNAGGVYMLPTFNALIHPIEASVPYQIDDAADVFAYERALFYWHSRRAHAFEIKVRVAGEGEWIDLLSNGRGTRGGAASIRERDVPGGVTLGYASFQVTSGSDAGIEIGSSQVQTGIFALNVGY
ncbi:hypothetical protein [Vitreimonas sp.]|uniref:hypothetical protein n=1 Tax=Vitreimonas sp. TaxID=3069702 RepID=UPI002EDBB242